NKASSTVPVWAKTSSSTEQQVEGGGEDGEEIVLTKKRQRNEDLDAALASTLPVLDSKHQRTSNVKPTILSVFPLPRDMARVIRWHPNSQLCVVAGTNNLYVFHSSGKYVEQLSKVHIQGDRVEHMQLTPSGDEAIVVSHESYVPTLVHLATEKQTPLSFLDTRENFAYRHDYRNDTHGRQYNFIRSLCVRPNDRVSRWVGVAHGNCLILGSVASGSVVQKIHTSDPIVDAAFTASNEVTIAVHDRLLVYDVRRTAKHVSTLIDEGSIGVTAMAFSNTHTAIASKSGVVNLYTKGSTGSAAPVKTVKNLTTAVSTLTLGEGRQGPVLVAATSEQKNGVRLVKLPEGVVVPSFPAVSARHGFFHCADIAKGAPVLSLGERAKVTNYVI
ncbi:Hypothetical protein, putative, partial [Bodo saltans]